MVEVDEQKTLKVFNILDILFSNNTHFKKL